jgi:hypothetical protein
MSGTCALSVPDQAKTEITFNPDGKLEIAVSFALESFSVVYIDGQTVMDEFNDSDNSHFELDLGKLSKTVTSIEIEKVGAKLTFGDSQIKGLNLTINAPKFNVNEVSYPVEKGVKEFVNNNGTITPENPNGSEPFPYSLTEEDNSKVQFEFSLNGNPTGSGTTGSVLKLENIPLGQEVTIIDCKPEVIFEWESATIDPKAAAGGDSDFTHGTFPGENAEPFTLMGKGNELEKYLTNMEFSDIKGYLFFSGPTLAAGNEIKLTLTAFPNSDDPTQQEEIATDTLINLISKPFNPPKGNLYTGNIAGAKSSTKEPLPFTKTFNRMLGGEALTIAYTLDFGEGLTIKKEQVTGTGGVKEFKADLVIILPLKLVAGKDGKEIDVTENLGERARNNLLDFTANMGDSTKVDFTTLALNITLTGAPITRGSLIIERPESDGVAANKRKLEIPLNSSSIKIDLADYLVGANPKFTPNRVVLIIKGDGGSLTIPQSLSLFELSVNAGVDVMYNF